ncbi:MAG: hypothetical protein Tsb0020_27710 [Haliangiales bacterium]
MTATRAQYDMLVCRGPVCAGQRDADAVYERLVALVCGRARAAAGAGESADVSAEMAADISGEIVVGRRRCFGRCQLGPNLHVRARRDGDGPPSTGAGSARVSALYHGVTAADIAEIMATHIDGGEVVTRLLRRPAAPARPSAGEPYQPLAVRGEVADEVADDAPADPAGRLSDAPRR